MIKFIKVGGEFFIDKLFQKDEFGVKTQKLLNYITPNYLFNMDYQGIRAGNLT
jgi:hypothetical protein